LFVFVLFNEKIEDDDTSSDEELVKGGIDFNFKAMLNGLKQANDS